MKKEFMDFITKKHDEFPPKEKQAFLRMLKQNPQKVIQITASSIGNWIPIFLIESKERCAIAVNVRDDSVELVEYFKQYFAEELKTIT
jgi:hypothetical protein